MSNIPAEVTQFVKRQKTQAFEIAGEPEFPYSDYYWRVVTCILLSGRVSPKQPNCYPNMIDGNRISKQANFNQYLLEWVGKLLVRSGIVYSGLSCLGRYDKGPHFDAFWELDLDGLRSAMGMGFVELFDSCRGHHRKPHEKPGESDLVSLLTLFFAQFPGQALRKNLLGRMLLDFSRLPTPALCCLAQKHGIDERVIHANRWPEWFDKRGREAIAGAISFIGWASPTDEDQKWLSLNSTGRIMLGLAECPARPELSTSFEILADGTVLAGTGVSSERLLPLFRHCRLVNLDDICEFKVDRKSLQQVAVKTSAEQELAEVFSELGTLPLSVAELLADRQASRIGGKLKFKVCSGIIKPADAATVKAIRAHPRLKGYLDSGSPPGYLLIKSESSLNNFLRRCRELGFELERL